MQLARAGKVLTYYSPAIRTILSAFALLTGQCISFAANTSEARQPHVIEFACAVNEGSPAFRLAHEVYSHAFEALGFEFRLVSMPPRRATAELANGNVDGDCGRSDHPYFSSQTHIVQLDVAVFQLNSYLWYYQEDFADWTPEQAREDLPRVAVTKGNIWSQETVEAWSTATMLPVKSVNQGLRMLQRERADLLLSSELFVHQSAHVQSGNPLPERGVLVGQYALYPLLHTRHQALVPALTEGIRQALAGSDNPLLETPSPSAGAE